MRRPDCLESLYLDFDGFFANAEKTLRPELHGRPVGVVPLKSNHTSLIARCYLAKRYGIKRGTSVQEAQRLCPQIALPIARHDEYVRLHQKILALINRHVPVRKVWSIDEMECCLKANERAQAIQIAKAIKRDLAEAFGPDLTCSIGL
ncbi:MAG: type VI secretion protein ImpB, partial [Pseudomonadota bacterium]